MKKALSGPDKGVMDEYQMWSHWTQRKHVSSRQEDRSVAQGKDQLPTIFC